MVSFGQNNAYLGNGAGTGGSSNVAIGYNAGHVNTNNSNVFVGSAAGYSNTSGWLNVFVGSGSGQATTTGSYNSFFGPSSGYNNTTGNSNSFFGQYSGNSNTTGYNNSFFGNGSGSSNSTSFANTGIGYNSLFSNRTGTNNTALGAYAGFNSTGSSNLFLGYQAGYNETGSNKLYISNTSTSTPLIYGDFSTKQVGINALPTSTYTLNVGGTINVTTDVFINGKSMGGSSYWSKAGSNVYMLGSGLGIGTTLGSNPNSYLLAVNGKIGAKEVQIENTSATWPDFVFKNDYMLMSLKDVEKYINQNGHLPEIPSEAEVKQEGIRVGEMNAKLLQKIEELTLYVIEANKKIEKLTTEVNELKGKK